MEVAAGSVAPGGHEIITAAGPGGGPHVQAFAMLEDPNLDVDQIQGGLEHPWDVAELPNGDLLFSQRYKGLYRWVSSTNSRVTLATPSDLFHEFETGMLGVELDPGFNGTTNRTFYACQGYTNAGVTDIRVGKWQMAADLLTATKVSEVVTGIPITSGRHGGCRIRFDPAGAADELYVTTGDAAIGTTPQDLTSLGGKVLKVQTDSGVNTPAPDNPFVSAVHPNQKLIYTYGHRNGQGLAFHPDTGELFMAEHGPDRDDEINVLLAGKNYGWNPVPGYNESVPMTNFGLPSAFGVQGAVWSSGFPTIATSGADFLDDPVWKGWNGSLAVANLKGQHLRLFHIGMDGSVTTQTTAITTEGRLRTPRLSRDGKKLWLTTDNAGGGAIDKILMVTPS